MKWRKRLRLGTRRLVPLLAAMLVGCSHPGAERDTRGQTRASVVDSAAAVPGDVGGPSTSPQTSASTDTAPISPPATEIPEGGSRSTRSTTGMVVSVEANASEAGAQILKAGGNAVDAAVAVAYALAVTHPSAGNLGGGGFMLVHLRGSDTVAIDFRERAPTLLTQAKFDAMIRGGARGPAAVGVPGSVAGLDLALARYGRLALPEVIAPAIRLARQGHHIGKQQARALGWSWRSLRRDPEASRIFGDHGRAKRQGDLLVQTDLATTLEQIAARGDEGFYTGPVARAIDAALERHGMVRARDLADYRAVVRAPLSFEYRGFRVETAPPPSAGGVAVTQMLLMLQRLEAFRLPRESSDALHLFIEVARRAHAERRFGVLDPDSPGYDAAARLSRWLDPTSLLDAAPPIDPKRATPSSAVSPRYKAALRELEHTTHFSVIDAEGNAVSCTTTLSASFGAQFVVPGTGVVMNNSLAAFGTVGDSRPVAGQRMTSSMAPTLLLQENRPVAVLGSPGGDTIPNTVVQIVRNLVDYRMTLDDAVDAPRIHHGFIPDRVRWEAEHPLAPTILQELEARGHRLDRRRVIGDANSIVVHYDGTGSTAWGYVDPREGGLAATPE